VGTNTLRVAKNAAAFLKKAEAAMGSHQIIGGHEEAVSFIWVLLIAFIPNNRRYRYRRRLNELILGNRLNLSSSRVYTWVASVDQRFFRKAKSPAQR
jgi:exopolyphosphatase/guanosine-5'-triphosphate,3'-diphosphate pyrophosphatase